MSVIQAMLGLMVFLLVAWGMSERKGALPWKEVAVGLGLQFGLAFLFLTVPVAADVVGLIGKMFGALGAATLEGTKFVFGYVGGAEAPFEMTKPQNSFVFMFQLLPIAFVTSAVATLLWYWGALPWMIKGMARLAQRTMGVGGAAALGAVANMFFAMTQAILIVRPAIATMSRSDMLVLATAGMTTIDAGLYVIYSTFLQGHVANPMNHVLVACVIHVPAGILLARLMIPPVRGEKAQAVDKVAMGGETYHNAVDAFFSGAIKGMPVWLNVMAVLVAAIAGIKLVDMGLALLPLMGGEVLTLQRVFGWVFAPLAWLVGMPLQDVLTGGALIGTKTIVNEFVALANLSALPGGSLTPISGVVLSYVLISFANPGTAAMMMAAMEAYAPSRKKDIVQVCTLSMLTGLLATCMTGAVMAILVGLGLVAI